MSSKAKLEMIHRRFILNGAITVRTHHLEGEFEGLHSHWLCWTDAQNEIIPAGKERAERLAAQLRALGIEPEA